MSCYLEFFVFCFSNWSWTSGIDGIVDASDGFLYLVAFLSLTSVVRESQHVSPTLYQHLPAPWTQQPNDHNAST